MQTIISQYVNLPCKTIFRCFVPGSAEHLPTMQGLGEEQLQEAWPVGNTFHTGRKRTWPHAQPAVSPEGREHAEEADGGSCRSS